MHGRMEDNSTHTLETYVLILPLLYKQSELKEIKETTSPGLNKWQIILAKNNDHLGQLYESKIMNQINLSFAALKMINFRRRTE